MASTRSVCPRSSTRPTLLVRGSMRDADEAVATRRRADRERPSSVRQGDQHDPRPDQLPHPPGDEVEERLELDLGRERRADLVEALELAEPAGRGLVEARVLDRDGRLRGEEARELLVLCR